MLLNNSILHKARMDTDIWTLDTGQVMTPLYPVHSGSTLCAVLLEEDRDEHDASFYDNI